MQEAPVNDQTGLTEAHNQAANTNIQENVPSILLDESTKGIDTLRIEVAAQALEDAGIDLTKHPLAYNAEQDVFFAKGTLELTAEQLKALEDAGINANEFDLSRSRDGLQLTAMAPAA